MMRLLLPALGSAALLMAAPLAAQNYEVQPRIYGGDDAANGDWPWMSYLRIQDVNLANPPLLCGGVLIAPDIVISAAHCVYNDNDQLSVRATVLVDDVDASSSQYSATAFEPNIIPHQNYDSAAKNYRNDIVLMKLSDELSVSQYPSLSSPEDISSLESFSQTRLNDIVTALGWGQTESGFPVTLQQVKIDYIKRSACVSQWNTPGLITSNMICAAEPNPATSAGEDTCFGDSGGPLLVGAPENPVVIGLTSFGPQGGCGQSTPPGVYTRIASYIGWIEQEAAKLGRDLVDVSATLPASIRSGIGTTTKLTMTVRNASVFNEAQDIQFTVNVPAGTVIDNLLLDGSPASCTGVSTITCDVADTLAANAAHTVTMDIAHTGDSDINRTLTFNVTHNRFDYRSLNNTDVEVRLTFSDAPIGGGGGSSGGAMFYTLPWLVLGAWWRRRKWSVSQLTSSSASSSGAR